MRATALWGFFWEIFMNKSVKQRKRRRSWKGFLHLVRSFMKKMQTDQIDVYSAQASFFLIMSFVPMLMMGLMILRLTPILTEEDILDTLSTIMNAEIMVQVEGIVGSLYHGSMAGMFLTALSLFWLSGRGVMGIEKGLNRIYRLKENRNYFYLRIRSSVYTLGILIAFMLSMLMIIYSVKAGDLMMRIFPFIHIHSRALRGVASLIALVMTTLIFNMLYTFLPNRIRKFRQQIYGAIFTTISWGLYSFFFVIYLNLAKNLSVIYGGLLTIVIAMMWLYYGIYLFFFGAEINAWVENPDSFPF